MSPFKRAVVFMNRVFSSKHLMLINTASCGIIMGFGDISMQAMDNFNSGNWEPNNWRRTGRMVCMGFAMGPLSHVWYTALDRFLPAVTTSTVLKKILLDQVIGSPVFNSYFFMGMGTLEGHTVHESWAECRSKFWDVYKADWTFWPAVQAINFRFVSPKFRVVYVASATYVWNTFLSYMKHLDNIESEALSEDITPPYIQESLSSIDVTATGVIGTHSVK